MRIAEIRKKVFWLIALCCIALLWYFQYIITINIPWWDDFQGILLPVSNLFSNSSISDKFHFFVSLNNEHRVINDRVFTLIVYLFRGTFDLKLLAMLGFINLIGCFLVIYKISKPYVSNILYLLPIIFLIFQAQYFESLQSLMVPFQNFSVLFYVFLSIYFLIYNSKYSFYLALVFGIFSLFTHGNGLIALLIGFCLLLFQFKYRKALIWLAVSLGVVIIYFLGYSKPHWSANEAAILNPTKAIFYAFEFLGAYILNILDLSANASNSIYYKITPTIFGILLVFIFFFIILKKYPIWKKNRNEYFNKLRYSKIDLFLICGVIFFLATSILIGIGRNGFPIFSRYTINSAFFIIFIYLLVLFNFKKKKYVIIIFSTTTFFILLISYFNNIDKAIINRKDLVCDAINWQKNKTWMNSYTNPVHLRFINHLLNEPYQSGKYEFPSTVLNQINKIKITGSTNIEKAVILGKYLIITDKSNIGLCNEDCIYYELKSENNSFLFPASQLSNNIFQAIKNFQYLNTNFKSYYTITNLPKNNYKLFRIEVLKNKIIVKNTHHEFDLN